MSISQIHSLSRETIPYLKPAVWLCLWNSSKLLSFNNFLYNIVIKFSEPVNQLSPTSTSPASQSPLYRLSLMAAILFWTRVLMWDPRYRICSVIHSDSSRWNCTYSDTRSFILLANSSKISLWNCVTNLRVHLLSLQLFSTFTCKSTQ